MNLAARIQQARQTFLSHKEDENQKKQRMHEEYQAFSISTVEATPEAYAEWLQGYMQKNPRKEIQYSDRNFSKHYLEQFVTLTQDCSIPPEPFSPFCSKKIIVPEGVEITAITAHNPQIFYMKDFTTTVDEIFVYPEIEEILCNEEEGSSP